MRAMTILVGAALALAFSNDAAAQTSPSAAATPQMDSRAVVAEVRRIVGANYVLPEVRPKLDAALAKGLSDGRYDVSDPSILADRINADLGDVAHDKHLGVRYDPQASARLAAAEPHAITDDPPPTAEDVRDAQRANFGIVQMKVLPGNIRYLETQGFEWVGPKNTEAYDNAMRFLRGGDAVIIDLRRNGGGSGEAVQYMISHFLAPDRPLVTNYMGANHVDRALSLRTLPAGRMVGKPLYVLTSGMSASAAEEFVGHVAGYKIGEIIGETTAGAGFHNDFFPLPNGMVISVSVGRAVLASTGKDWEGVGIAPTTVVAPDKALNVAQVHALRRLASTASGDEKRRLEAQAAVFDAQVNPVATALPLASYAGSYGERSVKLDGDALLYRRQGGPQMRLVAVGANEFSSNDDPAARIRFTTADGNVTALELVRGDGSKVEAQRTQ
jgi:hypothetical protein